jgi:hypothetical protein
MVSHFCTYRNIGSFGENVKSGKTGVFRQDEKIKGDREDKVRMGRANLSRAPVGTL